MVEAKAFRLRLDHDDGGRNQLGHFAPLTPKTLMKKTRFNETRRSGRKLAHLLHLHTNTRGEVSPGLQIAIQIAGLYLSARLMSPRESDLESGALLLEGRNHRVLWSPGERLTKLKRLADALKADWIANWDGYAKTQNIQSASEHVPVAPEL